LGLIYNKATFRSYKTYFPCFLHLYFRGKWFLRLYPKLPSFVQKPQGILGVKFGYLLCQAPIVTWQWVEWDCFSSGWSRWSHQNLNGVKIHITFLNKAGMTLSYRGSKRYLPPIPGNHLNSIRMWEALSCAWSHNYSC
jgi:hypothetical protein